MKQHLKFHQIPIYDFRLWIGVFSAGDGKAQRKKLDWALGQDDEYEECPGCLYYNRSKLFVQFDRAELSHALIAHETFHIAHRIMEYIQMPFTEKTHEAHAYLVGYVTQLIYKDLAGWKVPVKLIAPLPPSIRK